MRTTRSFLSAKLHPSGPLLRSPVDHGLSPVDRETLSFDVVVVGAGPAGLATAYRLRTMGRAQGVDLSVCVVEKAARIGGHLLAGALLDSQDLAALVPDWKALGAPLDAPVRAESFYLFTRRNARALPIPKAWRHDHHHMVSLGALCRWLAGLAEAEGVEIFPGFAAAAPLWEGERLAGVICGDLGRNRLGQTRPGFQAGAILRATMTVIAEGCRGSLSGEIVAKLKKKHSFSTHAPQRYALGFKELWQTPGTKPGRVLHSMGWPLMASHGQKLHGGGFLYQPKDNQTAVGLVVDLDYKNPFFDPFMAFQHWKNHPKIRPLLHSARLLAYGARTLTVGGWQSLPPLTFPGGLWVGDSAGFLNTATLQGIGNALGSGILAADTLLKAWAADDFSALGLRAYADAVRCSSWGQQLYAVRNVRPGFRWGLWPGLLHAAWEESHGGRFPWTLRWSQTDRQQLQPATNHQPPLPAPAPSLPTLDRATALATSGLRYEEDQPLHVYFQDPSTPLQDDRRRFANPETRFCPAGVFELRGRGKNFFSYQMHANHCLHCKCCDIKDPLNSIRWTVPQGGSGPDYQDM